MRSLPMERTAFWCLKPTRPLWLMLYEPSSRMRLFPGVWLKPEELGSSESSRWRPWSGGSCRSTRNSRADGKEAGEKVLMAIERSMYDQARV